MVDSGASRHVTGFITDFISYKKGEFGVTMTANGPCNITALGTVIIKHDVNGHEVTTRLHPVIYFKELGRSCLLSMGEFLHARHTVKATGKEISFFKNGRKTLQARRVREDASIYELATT